MAGVSTIRRLPVPLRDAINAQLEEGRTLDEITAAVQAMGAQVSRSALGRHRQQREKIMERVRRSRDVAETMISAVRDEPESRLARANVEFMHSLLMDMMGAADSGEGVNLTPREAMELAKAVDHLTRAKKDDVQTTLVVEAAKETMALDVTQQHGPSIMQVEIVHTALPCEQAGTEPQQ